MTFFEAPPIAVQPSMPVESRPPDFNPPGPRGPDPVLASSRLASPRPAEAAALRRQFRRAAAVTALGLKDMAQSGGRLAWIGIRQVLAVVFALILLFEQWGWKPLAAALATLSHFAPVAALERAIGRLPPYGALSVFGIPAALLVPVKLFALYLIARGDAAWAVLLFVGAKVLGTAVIARLYHLTQPQLMQIAWVRQLHAMAAPRLHALHEQIRRSWAWRYGRMVKTASKLALTRGLHWIWSRWRGGAGKA